MTKPTKPKIFVEGPPAFIFDWEKPLGVEVVAFANGQVSKKAIADPSQTPWFLITFWSPGITRDEFKILTQLNKYWYGMDDPLNLFQSKPQWRREYRSQPPPKLHIPEKTISKYDQIELTTGDRDQLGERVGKILNLDAV